MGSTGTTSSASGSLTVHERWYFANATWAHPGPNTPVEITGWAPGGSGAGGSTATNIGAAGTDGGNVTVTTNPGGVVLLTALGGGKGVAGVFGGAFPAQNTQGFALGKKSIRTGGAVLLVAMWPGAEGGPGFQGVGDGGAAGDNFIGVGGSVDLVPGYGGNAGEVKFYAGPVSEDLDIVVPAAPSGGAGASGGGVGTAGDGQKGQPGAVRIRWLE